MSALILLSNYDNMKKQKNSRPYKESEVPVDMKTMRAHRAESLARSKSTDAKILAVDKKVDAVNARIDAVDAKVVAVDRKVDALNAKVDAGLAALNAKFDTGFAAMNAKIDAAVAEMKAMLHQAILLIEEQNLRNKQAYDAAAVTYEAVQDLKRRIRPECLND